MKDISLHILDIAQNSVKAEADSLRITLLEDEKGWLTLSFVDDGDGMSPEVVAQVCDPFYTSRSTRRVGMGVALLKMLAQQTGGDVTVESQVAVGTTVTATFHLGHIDCPPLGDLGDTVSALVQGAPHLHLIYLHQSPKGSAMLDTDELRAELGEDIPLSEPDVALWLRDYMREQEGEV